MNFNVPQFIDIEDKIAFQLTAKQLGWFGFGGVILFILWNTSLSRGVFFSLAIIIVILCSMLAFYKPAGLPLASFISCGFSYMVRPKVLIWKKDVTPYLSKSDNQTKVVSEVKPQKNSSQDEIDKLAKVLDATKF